MFTDQTPRYFFLSLEYDGTKGLNEPILITIKANKLTNNLIIYF